VSTAAIVTITLRNNIVEYLSFKEKVKNYPSLAFLGDDESYLAKGIWSFIINIPVLIIAGFVRNPQSIVSITGGVNGIFLLLIFPSLLVYYARKRNPNIEVEAGEHNPYKSHF